MSVRLLLIILFTILLIYFMVSFIKMPLKKVKTEWVIVAYILTIALLTFVITVQIIVYVTYELNINISENVLMLSLFTPAVPVFISIYLSDLKLMK